MPSIPSHSLDFSANRGHQGATKKSAPASAKDDAESSGPSGSKLQFGAHATGKEPEKDDTVYQPELSRKQKMKVCAAAM